MATGKTIGILTGGGDVPGLNSVIKSVVYRATEMGWSVIGIRKGWEGLTHMNPAAENDQTYLRPLTRENTRTIDRTGGTVLHTSRTNPKRIAKDKVPVHISPAELEKLPFDGKYYDFTSVVLRNLQKLEIGCLITIGGGDTLSFSSPLHPARVPPVAHPQKMENDVQGTEDCIGFSSAIHPAQEINTPPT